MKNKIFFLSLILFTFTVSITHADNQTFIFKTKTIEVIDEGNIIIANNGKAISNDKNLEIIADNFQYIVESKILKIKGNGIILNKSNSLQIKFENGVINEKKQLFEAFGKIEAKEKNKNIKINSKKIVFNYAENILFSLSNSVIDDNFGNNLVVDSFEYKLNKNLLKIKNLHLTDKNDNKLKTSLAFINTKTNNLFGKDVSINLDNKTFNKNNQPRLKGNSIKDNKNITEITKGVFTTCKKRDGCPPWELSAKKIEHDKKNKIIKYENAFLKIYDKPIIYFPRFHHPDPTVNRKSGFLAPSLKNSSKRKNFITLPYYLAISDNKDATFSPRFYDHEEILLQTEYRQANYKSNHISDFSLKVDDNKKLRSHFFYKYDRSFNLDNFIDSNFDLKIQTTSKDTYLKKNNIKTSLINDRNVLENSAKIDLSASKTSATFESIVYEDLNKDESDRFEYIIPKINFTKLLDNKTSLIGDFTFKSQALAQNYNTNVFEKININDLIFKSSPKITKAGLYSNYEFIIKNSNTDAQNSKLYKNKENTNLSGLIQINSSMPLIKENKNYKKILNPKFALKLSPSHTKDYRNDDNKIDVNNVFSLDRLTKKDTLEGGLSLTYGNDFTILEKETLKEIFNLKIANNLRLKDNKDLPRNSQIGQKTSSILSELAYKPSDNLLLKYSSSLKNNLTDINYENLSTEIKINNLITSFDYLNQNNSSKNNNSYITNTTKLLLDDSNMLSFSTRRNKTIDLTEYYNLAYQYKNDCLSASLEYNKEYYSDRDIKPDESIFLKLTIIPFNKNDSSNF